MEIHYMDGGRFETVYVTAEPATVIGYHPGTKRFLALRPTGETFWGTEASFDPPPHPPAAARKPQVGEVWIGKGPGASAVFLAFRDEDDEGFLSILGQDNSWNWYFSDDLARPATPEEAEPFRPILDGLKRSLGEA